MRFTDITEENADDFYSFIAPGIRDDLEREYFRGIGAIDDDGEPLGALVYELGNSESEEDTNSRILSLAADNDKTIDSLMSEYEICASEEDVAESYYELSDKKTARHLEKHGFTFETAESPDIVISMKDIKHVADTVKASRIPSFITNLSEISIQQYRGFVKNILFMGKHGLLEDIAYLPKNWFEQELCACALTDDEVTGALLMRKDSEGVIHVLLYTAFGPDYKRNLGLMMAYSANMLTELCSNETLIVIRRHNDAVKKLTEKLFASSKGDTVYVGKKTHEK